MKKLILIISSILLLVSCNDKTNDTTHLWVVEADDANTRVTFNTDTLDILSPGGNTVWYNQKLKGQYTISYRAKVCDEGGIYDRLSDLNCFWGANDPEFPKDLFERSSWRNGVFKHYNTLNLFYVGFGGNENTTTRFRKYHAEYYGIDESKIKPLIAEYTELPNLLEKDKWYNIVISVGKKETTFSVNGELLFSYELKRKEADGYFGLRFWKNHVIVTDFKVEEL